MKKIITVAIAGNPNSGKSTIFNRFTGARQHVGNYPGVTVERKEGFCRHKGTDLKIVDLPGIYSLTSYSPEEIVAVNFLLKEKPDVVIDIIDSSNLERNLYLAVQFIELGIPLVLAFNMSDNAESKGISIDTEKLSESLGIPIIKTTGNKGQGINELLDETVSVANGKKTFNKILVNYGEVIEREISKIITRMPEEMFNGDNEKARWSAIKLIENSNNENFSLFTPELINHAKISSELIEKESGEYPETTIAEKRYQFISEICKKSVRSTFEIKRTFSDIIDSVTTNRFSGIPVFLALMYAVFYFTFTFAETPMAWIESLFHVTSGFIDSFWPKGSESPLKSLLVDGVIGGVGGVIVFLPNILLLFVAISILEDTGYMARAAFVMDRLMNKIGLNGKSFIPMLIGFGCSVPAIMATRTLDNRRDRLTTMLVIPLMSCGARFPIYALIIPAFFPREWHSPMLWIIYFIGIAIAIVAAKILRITVLKGESTSFLMELPPYRMPSLMDIIIHSWERGWLYLKKAGTIILGISILLWALTSYPDKIKFSRDYNSENRIALSGLLSEVKNLETQIGIKDNPGILAESVKVEKDTEIKLNDFDENDPLFKVNLLIKESIIDSLENSQDGTILKTFINIRDRIRLIRGEFDSWANEYGENTDSQVYLDHKSKQESALSELRLTSPVIYAAALKYLDDIEKNYIDKIKLIENEKASEKLAGSFTGQIGHFIEPALKPLGFDWKIGTALIGALAAKEVFVAQMGIVFSVGEADEESETLRETLRANYTPLVAFCIMLFCLVTAPCMATIAVTKRESNSWKWAFAQLAGLTLIAYILTFIVYQTGKFLNIGI